MKKLFLVLIICLGFVTLAISQESIRLTPEAPEGNFHQGREYIPLSNEAIHVELGFDGISEDMLVFDLVVINGTDHSFTLNPENFYYLVLDDPKALSSGLPPRMTVQPGKVYKWYDRALEEHSSTKQINNIFGLMESGIAILANVSDFLATEDPYYFIAQDRQISGELEQVKRKREVVLQDLIGSGEILPGEASNGFICFPGYEDPAYLMFCFPLDNQEFQFVYHQVQAPHHPQ